MDIEYSLQFTLTKASSVKITKDRSGQIVINPNYLTDEQLNIIFDTFNKIITLHNQKT